MAWAVHGRRPGEGRWGHHAGTTWRLGRVLGGRLDQGSPDPWSRLCLDTRAPTSAGVGVQLWDGDPECLRDAGEATGWPRPQLPSPRTEFLPAWNLSSSLGFPGQSLLGRTRLYPHPGQLHGARRLSAPRGREACGSALETPEAARRQPPPGVGTSSPEPRRACRTGPAGSARTFAAETRSPDWVLPPGVRS